MIFLSTLDVVKEKKCCIVDAIILSVFVIVVIPVCATVFTPGGDNREPLDVDNSTNAPVSYTRSLIVQLDNSDIWALDIDNNNSSFVIRNWKDQIHSFDYYMQKTIYVGSHDPGKPIKSFSRQYPELLQPSGWIADKIAVDHVNGKVYVLDVSASNINIFDVLDEHYNIVISNLREPKDIALDSIRRLVFILQPSSIIKANIDGSYPKTIVETIGLTSFTIDHAGKIYYADMENINSVNYAGHEHQIVTKISNEVISTAALENNVYWIYRSYESDNSILNSCKTVNGSCVSVSEIPFAGIIMQIKAYNFEEISISNPCKSQAHSCDHMCIMNSTDSSRCVCSIGWQLETDSKSCKKADEFLLYVDGNYVKSRILDDESESFTEAMIPLKLDIPFSTECNFDFDVKKRMFVFSDGRDMYQTVLAANSKQIKIGSNETSKMIIPAVDWASNNLYYLSYEKYMGTVWKWNIRVHYMQSLKSFENDKLIDAQWDYEKITSLVIHPNRGVLFYTTIWNAAGTGNTKIYNVTLDGGSFSEYGKNLSISVDYNVLGIDCEDDRLYWFSRDKDSVYFGDINVVNFNSIQSINVKTIQNPITIGIYKSWLYLSTPTSIWRLDKTTGENVIQILPKFHEEMQRILGARIFSRNAQKVVKSHPCLNNNGGCQRYCFGVPSKTEILQKVCGCNKNEKLNPDGKMCHPLPYK